MTRKLLVAVVAFCISISGSYAQTPSGYMGKRLILNYNNLSFPSLRSLVADGELIFKYKHNFELEYIVARYKAIGLSATIYNADIPFESYAELNITYDDPQYGTESYYYRPKSGVISVVQAGIYYRISHSNVAPIGTYSQFQIDRLYYTVVVTEGDIDTYYSNSAASAPNLKLEDPYKTVMLSYAIGTQRVLMDIFVLRFAVRTSFVFGGLKITRIGDEDFFPFSDFIEGLNTRNYIQRTSKNTLLNQNLLNVTFGIGILLY